MVRQLGFLRKVTMKAAVCRAFRAPLEVEELDLAALQRGEV